MWLCKHTASFCESGRAHAVSSGTGVFLSELGQAQPHVCSSLAAGWPSQPWPGKPSSHPAGWPGLFTRWWQDFKGNCGLKLRLWVSMWTHFEQVTSMIQVCVSSELYLFEQMQRYIANSMNTGRIVDYGYSVTIGKTEAVAVCRWEMRVVFRWVASVEVMKVIGFWR